MQLLPGVGPASAGKALDRMSGASAPWDQLAAHRPPPAAAEHWPDLTSMMAGIAGRVSGWPSEIDQVRRWLQPHLETKYADAHIRGQDLEQLARIAMSSPSREKFLTDLTLDPPDATSDESGVPLLDEDYLILSTIHSAKGQEWRSVFVLNVVDGCMPSDLATGSSPEIEEERRLLYVAMTRAKDELNLVVPHRFYTHNQARGGDRHVYASRTRFIPAGLLGNFECKVWPASTRSQAAIATGAAGTKIDLGAKVRGMWRATGT
jgi:DNA helicase-2/ATP-dependent DNA helicase PcrA